MTITSVKELPGRDASFNDKFEREYTRTFLVVTDDKTTGPIAVANNVLIPQVFTSYSLILGAEFDDGARVTNISPRQDDDNPFIWEVVITYSTLSEDEDEQNVNPLLRPADVVMSCEKAQEVVNGTFKNELNTEDKQFGEGVRNSAGELFDPPPMKDISRPVLTITRNEGIVNAIALMDFADSVNAETFLGAAPRQLKMECPQFRRVFENGLGFWTVTYQMTFKRETWDTQLLDHGSYYLDAGSTAAKTKFTDVEGNPITGNLGANGDFLTAGATAEFIRFKVYKEKFFSTLGLESSLNVTI